MLFDHPAGANVIDNETEVGKPASRIEGPLKVAGRARYAYERQDVGGDPAYGYMVAATVGKGAIDTIDLAAARATPGFLGAVTYQNAGPLKRGKFNFADLLAGPEVEHYHQAVAVVVCETFEQAREAAGKVRVAYKPQDGAFDLKRAYETDDGKPTKLQGQPGDSAVGEFDASFAAAPVRLDETYTTPDEAHAMMEPHATIAAWKGDQLTVWSSTQMVDWHRADLATTLGVDKDKVRVVSNYVGGGFGSKLFLRADAVLAALAAREVGRPVKLALPRPLIFNNTTHRPATIQRIRIGADNDGKIAAIGHESWSGNLKDGRPEAAVSQTRLLYAGANRMTKTRIAAIDLPEGNAMRAPGEAPGMMALEIAMDEMAERLQLDPVEFRLRNDIDHDPEHPARPFSQRELAACLQRGAQAFGWSARKPQPRAQRDGEWWIGLGVAAAFRNHADMKSAARVRLTGEGDLVVETDMTDIGTGSYTIIAQTAAECLGVPLHRVSVRLGDSDFPVSCGSGGQFGAANSTSGVFAACMKLRAQIAERLGLTANEVEFADGQVKAGGQSFALAEAARDGELSAEDAIEFGDLGKRYQQSTFGAHFVEAAVHVDTAEIRVRRMLAVCAAGRILNPKTARSQVIGAMTMGVGAALMEELRVDKARGFFVNHDLASYEAPVHADIPHQDVIFLDAPDPIASPMKAKGVSELGLCGVAAAVANAVYNATGVRVRDYPITLDKLIGQMPVAT
jgi:xanthine dehydrogenase YagR molybdenum-binding subunit